MPDSRKLAASSRAVRGAKPVRFQQGCSHSAREMSNREMPLLARQADYNLAYLYFLRGDYDEALARLADIRVLCRRDGDTYHEALCDLDESEIYLELNLPADAAKLARTAMANFRRLGMPFEQGRADFRAGAVGELEVEEHDVRGVVRCSAERLGTARCLDDVECAVSGKLRADSLSDELLTLDDEDSRGHCVSLGCTRSPPLPALATSTRPS